MNVLLESHSCCSLGAHRLLTAKSSLPHPLSLSLSLPPVLQQKRDAALREGWEYARLAHLTYHISKHTLDFARRRRYLRKLVGDPRKTPIFHFKNKKEKVCMYV